MVCTLLLNHGDVSSVRSDSLKAVSSGYLYTAQTAHDATSGDPPVWEGFPRHFKPEVCKAFPHWREKELAAL